MTVPWPRDLTMTANAGASLATGSLQTIVGRSQYTATVQAVAYIPAGSVSGASGNNRTLTLYNRGTGAGTVAVAALTLVSGTNLTDNTAGVITLATGSSLTVAVGDVLEWDSTANASGVADPGGHVVVTLALRS